MTAATILHVGLLAPEDVAYLLEMEERTHRCDDWRHDYDVRVRREALDAESRMSA